MEGSATPIAGPRSDSSPTPIGEHGGGGFPLAGPSPDLDPRTHAYRQDLADVALAGQVVASHYAEPLPLTLKRAASLRAGPGADSPVLAELEAGTQMRILERSRGLAWGYAGTLVGYVPASAL